MPPSIFGHENAGIASRARYLSPRNAVYSSNGTYGYAVDFEPESQDYAMHQTPASDMRVTERMGQYPEVISTNFLRGVVPTDSRAHYELPVQYTDNIEALGNQRDSMRPLEQYYKPESHSSRQYELQPEYQSAQALSTPRASSFSPMTDVMYSTGTQGQPIIQQAQYMPHMNPENFSTYDAPHNAFNRAILQAQTKTFQAKHANPLTNARRNFLAKQTYTAGSPRFQQPFLNIPKTQTDSEQLKPQAKPSSTLSRTTKNEALSPSSHLVSALPPRQQDFVKDPPSWQFVEHGI